LPQAVSSAVSRDRVINQQSLFSPDIAKNAEVVNAGPAVAVEGHCPVKRWR
jgi:hypothetical protein